jgi:hypothetical protein
MPQAQQGLFRFGAFVAARGSSPIDQCSDIAPRTSARLQRLTFHQVPLLAARVVAAAIALAWCSGAVLDRLRPVSARHRRP